jgi:RHS repeat-associated protein
VLKAGVRELDLVLQYTVHPFDQVLGVYFAQARMYDAADRRFMAVDPVKGWVTNPQSMAQYTYVTNNPLKYIDPYGLVKFNFNGISTEVMTAISGREFGWMYGINTPYIPISTAAAFLEFAGMDVTRNKVAATSGINPSTIRSINVNGQTLHGAVRAQVGARGTARYEYFVKLECVDRIFRSQGHHGVFTEWDVMFRRSDFTEQLAEQLALLQLLVVMSGMGNRTYLFRYLNSLVDRAQNLGDPALVRQT